MFDRENIIGLLLLGLCLVVGGMMVYAIATGTRFRYTGPEWLVWVLLVVFAGGILFGLVAGRGGRRWPDPLSGRGGWRRWFRRDRDE
ncbi:MAG: hypothetical protein ACRDJW_13410 [Thermomicrobiales bacterium]